MVFNYLMISTIKYMIIYDIASQYAPFELMMSLVIEL